MTDSAGRGQSEVLGTTLLIGLTILSVGVVVVFAGTALDDARETTDVESAEHAMSQLDSRVALVALGRTDAQTIDLGRARGGSYAVQPSAGWLRITHKNYSGTSDTVLYNGTMGAVEYSTERTSIAYQGGGVWRQAAGGGSVMVSPPEFHYRGETLTLPLIQVRAAGSQSASGRTRVRVTEVYGGKPVFPDPSATYPNGEPYANPIQNGSLQVTVRSQYYGAWADFFRQRTAGNVTVYDANETVRVQLVVPSVKGDFQMPLEGDALTLRGVTNDHVLDSLNLTIAPDDADSAQFSNLKWSMYAEDGNKKLELHVRGGGNPTCGDRVKGTVYFTRGGGTYHGWTNDTAFPVVCSDWDGDGDDEARIVANWTSTTNFTYTSLSNSDLLHYNPSGSLAATATFDEHDDTVAWEPTSYSAGASARVNGTVNHYAAFFGPTLDLVVDDSGGGGGASGSVSEGSSLGTVYYGTSNKFVTYVHATENRVNVTFT